MQKENTTFGSLTSNSADDSSPPHFSRHNPYLSPISPTDYLNSDSSLYPFLYQKYATDAASFDGSDSYRHIHDTSSVAEYQQLYNRYALCLSRLRDSVEEVDALRRDNESLRISNADLSHRAAMIFSRERFISEFNRLSVSVPVPVPIPVHVPAPQPLAECNRFERRTPQKTALPKSISVRSKGYLKMINRSGRETTNLQKTVSQPCPPSQRVFVPGAKEEENALEFDVYNQGMLKTELCNKWEDTGACPYGENCQFAHGITELRPVIRHPRYKTEVCRMLLAGDNCPYGHRCHFRHSLTQEEKLTAAGPLQPPPPR